jgi:hypothetical protein
MAGQAAGLIGREPERAVLGRVLDDDGPLVVFVHGIAGIGKSALVRAFGAEARAQGATVLNLDGGAIEPTERGLVGALAAATGSDRASPAHAADRLAALGLRVVIIVDGYEVLRPIDPWLRDLRPISQ